MGREIKHVSLDFDWPLNFQWKGYMCPYTSQKCIVCDGSGYNKETKQLADDWYDFNNTGEKWCDKITQEEVDALIKHGRLMDFTHKFVRGKGNIKIKPKPQITAKMVNEWGRNGLRHDAINKWICIETRAKRLDIFGKCELCDGNGEIWFNKKVEKLADDWYNNEKYEPPTGKGWQVWETVSEGSPISPVFDSSDKIINWLIEKGYSRSASEKFIESEFALSGILSNGLLLKDIESCRLID